MFLGKGMNPFHSTPWYQCPEGTGSWHLKRNFNPLISEFETFSCSYPRDFQSTSLECLSIHTCSHFPGCLYSRADNTFYVSPFLKVKRKKFLTGSQRFLDAPLSPLGSQALTSHAYMKILLVIANSKQLIWHCKHICISQKTSWPNIYLTGLATRKGKFIVLIRWIYLEQGYQLVNICDCKEVLDPHIK